MKMKVEVIELPDSPNDDFKSHIEEREYPDELADRHCDLCIVCGWSTYPECMSWCQNEQWRREKEHIK